VERLIGQHDVKAAVVMLRTPDGEAHIELALFNTPSDAHGIQRPLAHTQGIRHIAFAVDDIEAVVATLQTNGAEQVGAIHTYDDAYKVCYVRGPEGMIVELTEPIT
jgi:4-hydroxyphenylpyruvate dioxygenase-like putative hemolysin